MVAVRRARFVGALAGSGLALAACSAIFEDPVQCKVDADCAAFSGARCDTLQHVCVRREVEVADTGPPRVVDAGIDAPALDVGPVPTNDASDAGTPDRAEAEAAPVLTYLSDLTPTSATSGYGPYEKDTSNGEMPANDGVTITLHGVTYQKGLGVHAASVLTYALGGNYASFITDVGVDDEVMDNGSVVFQVFVDDQVVFDSGAMTGATATKNVNVSVVGKQELKLVVTDAEDGIDSDHADWAGARLLR
jgi:hypothetical protein